MSQSSNSGGGPGPVVAFGPEEAGDFLNKINFKSLLEYLSAEVIVNRPEDPLLFVRNVLDNRIAERHEGTFAPNQVDLYLKKVYSDVEEHADEYGTLPPRAIKGVTANAADEIERLNMRVKGWEGLYQGMQQVLATSDPSELLESVIDTTVRHLEAEQAIVYLCEQETRELFPYVPPEGSQAPLMGDEGVAYAVIKAGEMINIKDPYSDPRFNQSVDHKTGHKTNSILAAPIKDSQGSWLGVIQVLNKANGSFHIYDQEFLTAYCTLVGIALQNSRNYDELRLSDEKYRASLELVKGLQEALGVNQLMSILSGRLPSIVQAERCIVYLVDTKEDELLIGQQGDTTVRTPLGLGIAGGVGATGEVVNIPDASKDCRYDAEQDKDKDYVTHSILCMPMRQDHVVVGVLELINKVDGNACFTSEDEDFLKSFLTIVTPILRSSQRQQSNVIITQQHRNSSYGVQFKPPTPSEDATATSAGTSGGNDSTSSSSNNNNKGHRPSVVTTVPPSSNNHYEED